MCTTPNDHYEWVWVQPQHTVSEFAVPFGACVIRTDDLKTLICNDKGEQFWIPSTDIVKSMHLTSQTDVDDMITLGDLQEYTILRNLEKRYAKKQIYTFIGSMLIAINPYEQLPIFSKREIDLYHNRYLHELPPHIYAISNSALQSLQRYAKNQSIVISGESGAGKTESTKLILQYFAASSGKKSWIEQQIIDANPVMEAFGNAITVRNDNSSRFGKYIEVGFDADGIIQGARIEQYLLEKSRIVKQNAGERNYHIFYSMLSGLTKRELQKLELSNEPKYYHYLAEGVKSATHLENDAVGFEQVRKALTVLNFSKEELWHILELLSAVLHLGNILLEAHVENNCETSIVKDRVNVQRVAALLSVEPTILIEALTIKTIFVQNEHVAMNLEHFDAIEGRDAFAKALYGHLFEYIVKRINDAIETNKHGAKNSIGILDIFGFENFKDNSFEQLCINYANENLQQFFVKHIFKMEQLEYENEGIKWVHINFKDNQDKLDLIGLKPMNIMSLLDDETKFPRGTDETFLEKLNQKHGHSSIYIKSKSTKELFFGVRHYAGVVLYNTSGFLEKNRDTLTFDLSSLVAKSQNQFLRKIYPVDIPINTLKKAPTLSSKFRNSLEELMRTLSASHPFFIRCIKPNENKAANQFDSELCVRQLRYAGMMETARIRRAGYPIRHTFKEFVERYKLLMPHIKSLQGQDYRKLTCEICNLILPQNADYQCGRQKIFLRDTEDAILEAGRSRIYLKSIKTLQRALRRALLRRKIKKQQEQEALKRQQVRVKETAENADKKIMHGIQRLCASIASRRLKYQYKQMRAATILFQAHCRGFLARRRLQAVKSYKREKLQNGPQDHMRAYLKQKSRLWSSDREPSSTDDDTPSDFIEKSTSLVDDVFGFLNDASLTGPVTTTVREKSQMFEREMLLKKNIPSKLLSRPVNYYEAPANTTRL